MAKNLLFPLLISIFASTLVFGNTEPFATHPQLLPLDSCDAPAPDSFRVTGAGGNFISLAWNPAWPGAFHVMTVSEQDPSGGWNSIRIYPNVPDSSITVDSLESGRTYRFTISTKCENGDASKVITTVDFGTIILELTLAGRTPKNPQTITCTNIPYQEYEWIGFRVVGEGASNTFEVVVNENYNGPFDPVAYIRRLINVNPIVAVDNDGVHPNDFSPIRKNVEVPFRLFRLHPNAPPETIGRVDVSVQHSPPSITVCVSGQDPWKGSYTYLPLFALETVIIGSGGSGGQQGLAKDPDSDIVRVIENPFHENLRLSLSPRFKPGESVNLRLFNTNAQLVFSKKFESLDADIELQLAHLPSGVYMLNLESEGEVQTLRIVKSR